MLDIQTNSTYILGFYKSTKLDNIDINASFIFSYICTFFLYCVSKCKMMMSVCIRGLYLKVADFIRGFHKLDNIGNRHQRLYCVK